jgi:lysophospholipase L1-like esterase
MWSTLADDFPGVAVLNRGFGGSELEDLVRAAPRLVVPAAPRLVVVYAGDNDLMGGKSPERVCADFVRLRRTLQALSPATRIAFIAIKPSPARWHLAASARQANDCIRQQMLDDSRLAFVDVFTPMLGPAGTPRPELYLDDGLHLNAAGYDLWRRLLTPVVLSGPP